MRITSINDIYSAIDAGMSIDWILRKLPAGIDPNYAYKIIMEYRSERMAIGWDENINFGAGKRMKALAREAEERMRMEQMKYERQYVFTGDELKEMGKFIRDDDGNQIEQKEHFDSEDFEI